MRKLIVHVSTGSLLSTDPTKSLANLSLNEETRISYFGRFDAAWKKYHQKMGLPMAEAQHKLNYLNLFGIWSPTNCHKRFKTDQVSRVSQSPWKASTSGGASQQPTPMPLSRDGCPWIKISSFEWTNWMEIWLRLAISVNDPIEIIDTKSSKGIIWEPGLVLWNTG